MPARRFANTRGVEVHHALTHKALLVGQAMRWGDGIVGWGSFGAGATAFAALMRTADAFLAEDVLRAGVATPATFLGNLLLRDTGFLPLG